MTKRLQNLSLSMLLCVTMFDAAAAQTLSPPSPPDESLAAIVKRVKQAVVIVMTYDCRGEPLLNGSGFFVEPGYLVTGLHVLDGACNAQIRTFDGRTYPVQGTVAVNERRDLALLQAATPASPQVTTLTVENKVPQEGEEVIVVNRARGRWNVSRGSAGEVWDFQNRGEVIRITPSIEPGASGGPVINRSGQVIGVASMQVRSAEELNFAVTGEGVVALQRSGGPRTLVRLTGARTTTPGR